MRLGPCALAVLLLAACAAEVEPTPTAAPRAEVSVGMHVVRAEVADTLERRTRGLSGRESLREGEGMVFPYAQADRHGFWMKDMRFDIDIVWIRAGRVVDVTHRAVHDPPGELPVYRPREPADLVLEVPAGTAERLGWRPGDPVRVDPPLVAAPSSE
jgi:uncharacterized membrane protein (UPF0127 family)